MCVSYVTMYHTHNIVFCRRFTRSLKSTSCNFLRSPHPFGRPIYMSQDISAMQLQSEIFRSQNSWVIHRFTDCGLSPNVIFWLNVESIMGNACNKRRCLPWLRRIHSCSFWRSLISSDVFLDYDRLSVL